MALTDIDYRDGERRTDKQIKVLNTQRQLADAFYFFIKNNPTKIRPTKELKKILTCQSNIKLEEIAAAANQIGARIIFTVIQEQKQ